MADRIPLGDAEAEISVPRLVAIVDVPTCRSRELDPLAAAGMAADAGAPAVLLRAKNLHGAPLVELADQVVRFCRYGGALALVSSDIEAATAARADGVHLPASMIGRAEEGRSRGLLVGASVHTHAELLEALEAGADYLMAAPVYDPSSKPAVGPALGLDALASLCRAAGDTPVLALGGITPKRVADVRRAGAHGVAALGPFCAAGGRRAVGRYLSALRGAVGAD